MLEKYLAVKSKQQAKRMFNVTISNALPSIFRKTSAPRQPIFVKNCTEWICLHYLNYMNVLIKRVKLLFQLNYVFKSFEA